MAENQRNEPSITHSFPAEKYPAAAKGCFLRPGHRSFAEKGAEKSQIQNKEKAFALLRTKLYDLELQKKQDAESEERRSQIGTGDRSEKIRTYNFPQGRVTDHRINLTLYKLDKILDGDIQEIIDACIAADQAKKLAKMQDEN